MRRLIAHLVIIGVGVVMIYPLLWMVSSSLKPTSEIFSQPGLPTTWTLENYARGWDAIGFPFALFLGNSALIAGLSVIGNLLSCTLAAYAFARLEFRFKKTLFVAMMATLMLPFQVILVPQYIMFNNLGMVDTYWPLLIPKFLAVDTFFIFLMIQFIRGLPRSLDDAAAIDGCGPFGVFWRIILPLMRPALAVTAAFTFIWTWNDFLTPLLYLPSREKFTVPLALNAFLDSEGASQWGPMFAMACLSLLPIFLIFLFTQKQLVNGIATTGLK
ncbi:carbohydrate ABC transporter permease [Microbacterium sp. NPDC056044]|uniref:carbohydrate ABC transporter permease n=1 Tax=Microbacterium sp. NPDC056044 TaxID=3345690 RepID=UPI0035E199C5